MSLPPDENGMAPVLQADIISAGDERYEAERALYNAMVDKRPRWIVKCENTAQIIEAMEFARDNDVLLAIRGGGHNGPGLGSCDGGLVIDLAPMKAIAIDTASRNVRVEPGCTQGELDAALGEHGLAVPAGIVSTTGIAGLTLGGGHGYLTRQYGLTIDNLLSAEVVLADGSAVTASEDEHPDLFWALRGGGGNFGIVTAFTFRTRPVSDIFGGPMFYDVAHTATIMKAYRDFLPGATRKLFPFVGMKKVPSTAPFPQEIWDRPVCAIISCYDGSEEEGRAAIAPLLDQLPEPLMDGRATIPFVAIQGLFDALLPKGLQWYWKGDYVDELTDEAIAAHVEHGGNTPSELSLMHLYPIDGAVHDVAAGATAWGARNARWSMVIAGIDPDPAKAGELKRWASDYWAAVHAHNPHGGGYVNFMMDDEGEDRVKASYGGNYERLRAVKRNYDPANLFRVNQNIRP